MRAAIVAAAVLTLQAPALADQVETLTGGDQHLYVRQVTSDVVRGGSSWNLRGGGSSLYAGSETRTVITRGDVPLTDERFMQLLKTQQASIGYASIFEGRKSTRSALIWGSLAAGAFGFGMMVWDMSQPLDGQPPNALYVSTAFAGMLLGIGAGTVAFWDLLRPPRHFTTEEAVDAANAYNKALD